MFPSACLCSRVPSPPFAHLIATHDIVSVRTNAHYLNPAPHSPAPLLPISLPSLCPTPLNERLSSLCANPSCTTFPPAATNQTPLSTPANLLHCARSNAMHGPLDQCTPQPSWRISVHLSAHFVAAWPAAWPSLQLRALPSPTNAPAPRQHPRPPLPGQHVAVPPLASNDPSLVSHPLPAA